MVEPPTSEFERAASQERGRGIARDFWDFLRQNKKWWMLPIVAVLALFGVLVILSSSPLAPFIYSLF